TSVVFGTSGTCRTSGTRGTRGTRGTLGTDVIPPDRVREPAGIVVEVDGAGRAQFGEKDDLPEVHREVLHADEDRVEHRDLPALNRPALEQRLGRQAVQNLFDLVQCSIQCGEQVGARWSVGRRELSCAMTDVGRTTDAADHPLSDVA